MDAEKAMEQIVIQAGRSILEGCHHVPDELASAASRQLGRDGTRLRRQRPSFHPPVRPPHLPPKVKQVFPGNANRSSCVPNSKTTADGENAGRLRCVRLSTVARLSGGHLQQVGRDVLSSYCPI